MKLLVATLLLALCAVSPAYGDPETTPPARSVEPLLAELRARQMELDRRERAIEERERTHAELEALVKAQLEEIEAQRATMKERISAWEMQDGQRIARLAKIYEAMKPAKAARLIDGLDANLSTQILSRMKHKKSAAVIERISQDRALTVSRQVAHPLSFDPAAEAGGGT